jgi:hypothetical protein
MSALWRQLGPPHQCHPTRALAVRHAHDVAAETQWWCPECHRLWVKTSRHRSIGRRSVCGCGWRLVGTFTNAEALARFWARLDAEYETEVDGPVALSTLTIGEIAALIRLDREEH